MPSMKQPKKQHISEHRPVDIFATGVDVLLPGDDFPVSAALVLSLLRLRDRDRVVVSSLVCCSHMFAAFKLYTGLNGIDNELMLR